MKCINIIFHVPAAHIIRSTSSSLLQYRKRINNSRILIIIVLLSRDDLRILLSIFMTDRTRDILTIADDG